MMLKNAGIIIPVYLTEKFLKPENENLRTKTPDKNVLKSERKTAPYRKNFRNSRHAFEEFTDRVCQKILAHIPQGSEPIF
jgi:hypothetical protein